MKSLRLVCWCVVLVGGLTWAENITIYDANSVISTGQTFETVVVRGAGTVLRIDGATITMRLIVNDGGAVEMTDGSVLTTYIYDGSVVEMTGGTMDGAEVFQSGTFLLAGSGHCTSIKAVECKARVIIDSPDATTGGVSAFGGVLELRQGTATSVDAYNGGVADIRGGAVEFLNVQNSQAFLRGGAVGTVTTYYLEPARIHVIGHDLEAIAHDGAYGFGQVTGFWNDDQPFTVDLGDASAYAFVRLYDGWVPPRCENPPRGDTTGDCKVDLEDLAQLAEDWMTCGLADPADCGW